MNRLIYFSEGGRCCHGERYTAFLDYAFAQNDCFLLVYPFRRGSRYAAALREYRDALAPYLVKMRREPYWPGTVLPYSETVRYEVSFYRTAPEAKEVLRRAEALTDWAAPRLPQDLAFFRRSCCWFYYSCQEHTAAVLHASPRDLAFLAEHQLADPANALPEDRYFDLCNEPLDSLR